MLTLAAIDKAYGMTHAVKAATIEAAPGTVLGLVGENGAGKSTLIKIVSGAVRPDSGAMTLEGRIIAPRDTTHAISLGIASVFQELTLVRELSVECNLLLTDPPTTPWRTIDRRRLRARAVEIIGRYGLDIDPAVRVGELPLGRQQMLEIARALERRPKVLVLDEATSALGASEVAWLAGLVETLRAAGCIVLFISHRWDEIAQFCGRVAVMRNGAVVSVADTAALSEDEAIRLMTGEHGAGSSFPPKHHADAGIALTASGLRSNALNGVGLDLRKGEIIGLGGLVGQGQSGLLEALFGAHALAAGEISLASGPLRRPTPRAAVAAGIAYVPQERKTEGLLLTKSVAVNATLAILPRLKTLFGLLDGRAETALVQGVVARSRIRTRGAGEAVRNLSGGNQQKVLLERWLLTAPAVLLLNDVTRGVDVATKRHIYAQIAEIAQGGVGVIWYSTDVRELVGLAHRVLVMRQGAICAELAGDALDADAIVRAAVLGTARTEAGDVAFSS